MFTEFDCSAFGSFVLLYGLSFNIKLQYVVRLGPAVKMHGFALQMHLLFIQPQNEAFKDALSDFVTSTYSTDSIQLQIATDRSLLFRRVWNSEVFSGVVFCV